MHLAPHHAAPPLCSDGAPLTPLSGALQRTPIPLRLHPLFSTTRAQKMDRSTVRPLGPAAACAAAAAAAVAAAAVTADAAAFDPARLNGLVHGDALNSRANGCTCPLKT